MITLTRRPLSVPRALHELSSCVLCLAPPAVDLLEALDRCVCVRDGLAASVCVNHTSAASVELLPRGWRAVAFPRWLHDQSGSTWLIVILIIIRKIFVVASAACVYETGLLLVCACRAPAASVEPLPPGSRAVAFPRWLQVLSCSTWLIVRCCINSACVFCFGCIGAT